MYRVMIADDESLVRRALTDLVDWQHLDCELVYSAVNGRDLLDNLAACRPHIVITDIKMPDTDGIEIARLIHERGSRIKVIFLTGFADFSYAKAGITYGIVDYVVKTGTFDGLSVAIETAKRLIADERNSDDGRRTVRAAFYRQVFDRSLHDPADIASEAEKSDVRLYRYAVAYCSHSAETAEISDAFRRVRVAAIAGGETLVVPMTENTLYVVMELESNSAESVHAAYRSFSGSFDARSVQTKLELFAERFGRFQMRIGISEICRGTETLSAAGAHARAAYSASFYAEDFAVAAYRGKTCRPAFDCAPELQLLVSDLLNCILNYDDCGAAETEQIIFNLWKDNGIAPDEVRLFIADFANRCKALLSQKGLACGIAGQTVLPDFAACRKAVAEVRAETILRLKAAVPHALNVVQETRNWIAAHYCEPLSLERIAARIGVTGSYLSRIFSEKTHVTLTKYVNDLKMQQAKRLLSDPFISVADVALQVGMENVQYFCKLFKKTYGESPSAWRNKNCRP